MRTSARAPRRRAEGAVAAAAADADQAAGRVALRGGARLPRNGPRRHRLLRALRST